MASVETCGSGERLYGYICHMCLCLVLLMNIWSTIQATV